jgi:predicted metal-dependent HD superfamily phosphohydrolase
MIEKLRDAAKPWYMFNAEARHYHNWEHARKVAVAVWTINPNPSDELVLAAWWHDAVYVPNAGADANERCSAAALVQVAGDADVVMIGRAADLIRHTSMEYHMTWGRMYDDIGILLDADLSSWAGTYKEFCQQQDNILLENPGATKQDTVAFLQQMMGCRDRIFHTDYARKHWEQEALDNIHWFIFDNKV